jgi:gamma-glutamyltranspeptidase/glutathione hydrolase
MIIPFVADTLIALIDWKMDMQAAVSMPHLV